MTEAADAKPEPGWYAAHDATGVLQCIEYKKPSEHRGYWAGGEWGWPIDMPPGWTLGPAIIDLLRDAARYRWLRDGHRLSEVFIGTGGDAVNLDNETPEQVDAILDAEMAREPEPEGKP